MDLYDVKMGININCKWLDFLAQIFSGLKTIETRNTHSLRPYIGKRVGLIETGKGKARLVGFATVSEEVFYPDPDSFQKDFDRHQVTAGSRFDCKTSKYGYILTDVVKCIPVQANTKGIISRNIGGIMKDVKTEN